MKPQTINKQKQLRYAYVFLGPFPQGNVSTMRILSYCKALVEKGVFVKVYLVAPTAEAACNDKKEGVVDGVHFQYVSNITWKKKNTNLFVKLFYYGWGLLKTALYIAKGNYDAILSYTDEVCFNSTFQLVAAYLKIPYILDKTEYPANYYKEAGIKKRRIHYQLRKHDGIITITSELQNFYAHLLKSSKESVFLLPMTIDIDRFSGLQDQKVDRQYIAVLFGTHNRDGLYDTVRAYDAYVELTTQAYDLVLVGDMKGLSEHHPEIMNVLEFIHTRGLEDRVILRGLVSNNEIPQLLLNASCLLSTPRNFDSGGFPTKLGEYLLSGKPVVTTKVGEIPKYLTNQKNALLADPGDWQQIAAYLFEIQQNPDLAKQIGDGGVALAKQAFNAIEYADDLVGYIKNIAIKKHPSLD